MTAGIDTVCPEPIVDCIAVRNLAEGVLHGQMGRPETVYLLKIAVDTTGNLSVLQQALRFWLMKKPILTYCVHIRDGKQALVAALEPALLGVQHHTLLDTLQRVLGVGLSKQLRIETESAEEG